MLLRRLLLKLSRPFRRPLRSETTRRQGKTGHFLACRVVLRIFDWAGFCSPIFYKKPIITFGWFFFVVNRSFSLFPCFLLVSIGFFPASLARWFWPQWAEAPWPWLLPRRSSSKAKVFGRRTPCFFFWKTMKNHGFSSEKPWRTMGFEAMKEFFFVKNARVWFRKKGFKVQKEGRF